MLKQKSKNISNKIHSKEKDNERRIMSSIEKYVLKSDSGYHCNLMNMSVV